MHWLFNAVHNHDLRRREAESKISEANKRAAASLKIQKELEDRIKHAEAKGEKRLQALREKMQAVSMHANALQR